MRKGLFVALAIIASLAAEAQQDPQFTHWMFDKMSFNPGATGFESADRELCLTGFFRNQWNAFENSPVTSMLNGSFRAGDHAFGLNFYNDELGQEKNTVARLQYAYHYRLNNSNNVLSGGIAMGVIGKSLGSDWRYLDAGDKLIEKVQGGPSANAIDMNLGLMFGTPGKYYVGASVTHVNGPQLDDLSIDVARHLYFMGGYNFDITGDGTFIVRSNVLAKTDLNSTTFDINANLLWNNTFWGGVSYRNSDAISPMFGYQTEWKAKDEGGSINKVKVGYTYDITTSEIKNYSSGSHGLFVTYCRVFGKVIVPEIYDTPRPF